MEGTNNLYQPSLKEGWEQTKSYDINNFFLLHFLAV